MNSFPNRNILSKSVWIVAFIQCAINCCDGAVAKERGSITSCSFPSFLVDRSHWESDVSFERRIIGTIWTFTRRVAQSTNSKTSVVTSYSCINSTLPSDGNTVFVRVTSSTYNPFEVDAKTRQNLIGYRCMRFVARSLSVVQVFKSASDSVLPDPEWCSSSQWILDDHPLISPYVDESATDARCAVVGAYTFSLQLSASNGTNTICGGTQLPPIWESDCGYNNGGISIDFRQGNCMGRLSLSTASQLRCIGTWTDISSNYTFSVLSNNDDVWPLMWMIRTPSWTSVVGSDASFTGHLSTEIATNVDPQMTPSSAIDIAYAMHMSPTSFGSLCEDEAIGCRTGQCDAGSADYGGRLAESYCQKTCNVCRSDSDDTTTCSFIADVQGLWLEVSDDTRRTNRTLCISRQLIQFDSEHDTLSSSHCVNLRTPYPPTDLGLPQRFPVATLYTTTGCRPRYACVELLRRSESVLTYRVGQAVQWPYTGSSYLSANALCNDNMFQTNDAANSATQLRTVIQKQTSAEQSTVECNLPLMPGLLLLSGHLSNGRNQTAIISTCDNNTFDQFTYVSTESSTHVGEDDQLLVSDVHRCLGAFGDSSTGDQYIATVASGQYYCWLFQRRPWYDFVRLYVTRVSDCNAYTGNSDVQFRGYTSVGYIASFDVVPPSDQLLEVYSSRLTLSAFSGHNCSESNFTTLYLPEIKSVVASSTLSSSSSTHRTNSTSWTSTAPGFSGEYRDKVQTATVSVVEKIPSGESRHRPTGSLHCVLITLLATVATQINTMLRRL